MRSILILVLLASCAAAPAREPDALLAEAWRGLSPGLEQPAEPTPQSPPVEPTDGSSEPAGPWTLDAVLEEIARAHPTLAVARLRLEEAREAVAEARAAYYPELSLGLDYTATDDPSRAFGLLLSQQRLSLGPAFDPTPGHVEDWRKEARLDWPLFAPGRGESRRAAGADEAAGEHELVAVERRLLNAGVQAWLGLRAARAMQGVALESIDVVASSLEQTRARYEEGSALRVDVMRLEVRLAAAREAAARAGLAVRQAESVLNVLMGRSPRSALDLTAEEPPIAPELPSSLDSLLELARAERLDVRAAAERVRMLAFRSDAAGAARLPSLGLFAAYDIYGPDPAIEADLDAYTIGVGLRLPISAAVGPRVRQAELRERAAREELRALALEVAREVRDAHEALGVARETLALAEASTGAAEEAFRIVAAAQDAGAATVTDVLEAERARNEARMRLVSARSMVGIARARLAAAIGGVR